MAEFREPAGRVAKPHLGYIDCARGYAVLMVITCHYTYLFPTLPYPIHRLTITGWFGVQLFFLASALTLLMSWHFELSKSGTVDRTAFFTRRFFRIAPTYYAAGLLYYLIDPPAGGFSASEMVATATFVNAWHPALMPTVARNWVVVPGNWSVGVEFTFYLIFPFFAAWSRTLARAIGVTLLAILIGFACNRLALPWLRATVAPAEGDNFLFFWFPNQLSVFALGGVLFFLIRDLPTGAPGLHRWLGAHASLAGILCAAGFAALAFVPTGHWIGTAPYLPASLAVCLPMMGFLLASSTGRSILVNRPIAAMGRVSFSAYLLHFAVLQYLDAALQPIAGKLSEIAAALAFIGIWPPVVLTVFVLAAVGHRYVELPSIRVGKWLMARHSRRVLAKA